VYGVARSIGWAVYERSGKFMFKLHLGGGRTPEDDDGDEDEEEDVEWMEEEGAVARGGYGAEDVVLLFVPPLRKADHEGSGFGTRWWRIWCWQAWRRPLA